MSDIFPNQHDIRARQTALSEAQWPRELQWIFDELMELLRESFWIANDTFASEANVSEGSALEVKIEGEEGLDIVQRKADELIATNIRVGANEWVTSAKMTIIKKPGSQSGYAVRIEATFKSSLR